MNAANAQVKSSNWTGIIYKTGGIAALACGLLLLITAFGLGNNWLITLFKLHAGTAGIQQGMLKGLNVVDLCILALTGLTFLCFFFMPEIKGKVLTIIAFAQPFLGIVLLISTQLTGRSAVMGGLLILSIAMIRSNVFGRLIAIAGLLASVLLLAGDISESMVHSHIIAWLMASGYVLLTAWMTAVGVKLVRR